LFEEEEYIEFTDVSYLDYCDDVNRGADLRNHHVGEAEEKVHMLPGRASRSMDAILVERADWDISLQAKI
jgi:hypothetical protein